MSEKKNTMKKYLQLVNPPAADGQIESLGKNQQLHSTVKHYGAPDNNVYFLEREEERIKKRGEFSSTSAAEEQVELLVKFKVKR